MEENHSQRTLSWDFTEDDNGTSTSSDDRVSEVMEFFEMAASLIRTLAPDSSNSKPKPNVLASSSSS